MDDRWNGEDRGRKGGICQGAEGAPYRREGMRRGIAAMPYYERNAAGIIFRQTNATEAVWSYSVGS